VPAAHAGAGNRRARGLEFDRAAVDRALGFFSEGQFEDTPFELHPSLQFIVGSIFGWKRRDGFAAPTSRAGKG
jgi:hypothetical protein